MNIVTKIFIVLTLVCSIVLSTFVALYLGGARELKAANESLAKSRQEAVLLLAAAQAKVADGDAVAAAQRSTYTADVSSLKQTVEGLRNDLTKLDAEKAGLESQLAQITSSNARQASVIAAIQGTNTLLTRELNDARPEVVLLNKQIAEVNMANEILTTKLEQATRAIDLLKVQLGDATKSAAAGPANSGTVNTLDVGLATAVPVNGKVTGIKDNNGKVYLSLSLGQRDNISVGTRFTISRGNKYVGDAVVERVTPDESVAVVRDGNPLPVKVDDLVSSGPQ